MRTVIITGSRTWTNYSLIYRVLEALIQVQGPFVLYEGEARGADRMAKGAARALGLEVVEWPANWEKYGRGAGFRRNIAMLDSPKGSKQVVAFWDGKSRGTQHTIFEARKRNIPVLVVNPNGTMFVLDETNTPKVEGQTTLPLD